MNKYNHLKKILERYKCHNCNNYDDACMICNGTGIEAYNVYTIKNKSIQVFKRCTDNNNANALITELYNIL